MDSCKALWRFPVLGMKGEQLRSSQVDTRGIAGDRQHFASGPEGQLDAQDLPRLALWTAAFPFNPDGAIMPDRPPPFPLLTAPERAEGVPLGRPAARATRSSATSAAPVELVRDLDLTRGVIVAATPPEGERAAAGINVQLRLDPPDGGWSGRELAFRDGVRLRLVASRADGPGIEARVVEAGRLLLGEPVTLS